MSLLTGEPRSSTCKALEDSELLCLDRESFSVLLQEGPAVAERVSDIIARRTSQAQEKLALERETVVRQRVPADDGRSRKILEKIWAVFGFKR